MYTSGEAHFSWTSRRVTLPVVERTDRLDPRGDDDTAVDRSGMTLDRVLPDDIVHGRLMAYHDAEEEREYVALILGEVRDEEDVPVRAVDEECLLIAGAHSYRPAEILVSADDDALDDREIDRQLRGGGPLHALLTRTGARSVVVACLATAA